MRRFPWFALVLLGGLFLATLPFSQAATPAQFGNEYLQFIPFAAAPPPTPVPTATLPPPVPPATVRNGGFEAGGESWVIVSDAGDASTVVRTTFTGTVRPHTGGWAAWLGGSASSTDGLLQRVTIPANATHFVYWYWIASSDICLNDILAVGLTNDDGQVTEDEVVTGAYLCSRNNTSGWRRLAVDVSRFAGQTRTLIITVGTDSTLNSNAFVDDIAIQAGAGVAARDVQGQPDMSAAAPQEHVGPASTGAPDPLAAQLIEAARERLAR